VLWTILRAMNVQAPTVSIIVPAYQVAQYVEETLRSVFQQSYTSWETIVVNDGSPDTEELERVLQPFRDRIRYLKQSNLGAGAARNAALKVARGEWVAFLDGDDCWLPTFLERQVAALTQRGLDMIWADGFFFGDTVNAGRRLSRMAPSKGPVNLEALIRARINVSNSGSVVRRSLIEAIGYFDESIRRGQDFDLWARLFARGMCAGYNPEPLFLYRVRSGNLTGDVLAQVERELGVLGKIRDKNICKPEEIVALDDRLHELRVTKTVVLGKRLLVDRNYSGAVRQLQEALRERPNLKLKAAILSLRIAPDLLRAFYLFRTSPEHR
jgi:glycosyltransferase involved in cell wall biosynthesis